MSDGEEPGPRILRVLELTDRPKGVEEGVLDQIVRIPVAADPPRQGMNPSGLGLEQRRHRRPPSAASARTCPMGVLYSAGERGPMVPHGDLKPFAPDLALP